MEGGEAREEGGKVATEGREQRGRSGDMERIEWRSSGRRKGGEGATGKEGGEEATKERREAAGEQVRHGREKMGEEK